jgi:hypothetical protein
MKFKADLVSQLQQWREEGDCLIVCLDANKDIYKKSLGKSFTNIDGLAMKEVIGEFTGTPVRATFFRGSKPINGVWATSDITVCNTSIMPVGYSIGDHRLFMIDFASSDIIRNTAPKIIQAASRLLNTKIPRAAAEYARILEEKIIQHRLIKRVGRAHTKNKSKRSITWRLNKLDKELGQYMWYAEKNCYKIKSGCIPFLPESSLWIHQTQVYRSLLKFHAGRIETRGNLKRSARQCNIPDTLSLLIQEIYYQLKACLSRCEYFQKNGHYYRRKHLYSRLEGAKEKEDEEAARQILMIIQRKGQAVLAADDL